jgi:hypothetical protein
MSSPFLFWPPKSDATLKDDPHIFCSATFAACSAPRRRRNLIDRCFGRQAHEQIRHRQACVMAAAALNPDK